MYHRPMQRRWQVRTEKGAVVGTFVGGTPAEAVMAMQTGQASPGEPPVAKLGRWSREHPVTTDLFYAGIATGVAAILLSTFRLRGRG